mmetsp:Transcript_34250/g.80238  ORF Transcript_34250/g.80238 Transcript_34250/m.80238 type:complete len:268 (+) Transcript_34250:1307-2110(+)
MAKCHHDEMSLSTATTRRRHWRPMTTRATSQPTRSCCAWPCTRESGGSVSTSCTASRRFRSCGASWAVRQPSASGVKRTSWRSNSRRPRASSRQTALSFGSRTPSTCTATRISPKRSSSGSAVVRQPTRLSDTPWTVRLLRRCSCGSESSTCLCIMGIVCTRLFSQAAGLRTPRRMCGAASTRCSFGRQRTTLRSATCASDLRLRGKSTPTYWPTPHRAYFANSADMSGTMRVKLMGGTLFVQTTARIQSCDASGSSNDLAMIVPYL